MGFLRRFKRPLYAVVLIVLSASCAMAHTAITVYSTSHLALLNVPQGVKVCNLDVKHALRLPFSAGLTANMSSQVKSWMKAHQSQLSLWEQQTVCRYQAEFLDLKYLPAIVMNNTYVVYGNSDVQSAIQAISTYRHTHRNQPKQQGGKL